MDFNKYLENLKTLVNVDCGSNTPEGLQFVTNFFKDLYSDWIVEYHELNGKNPVLVIKNRDVEKFDFLFIGHNDTVFPEGTVAERQFKIEGDIATGPGVYDMKSGLLSMYEVAKEFKDSKFNICIIINTDEEISSLISRDLITEMGKRTKYALVFEPARKTGNMVSERKGLIKFEITFKGKAAHAGIAPQNGINAIIEASRWVLEISKLQNLENGNSINVGVINGGFGVNTVPDKAVIKFEGRSHDITHFENIMKTLEELKANPYIPGIEVDIKEIGYRPPLVLNDLSRELLSKFDEVKDEMGIKAEWEKTGGGSDANFLGILGVGVLDGVGPIGGNSHEASEYLVLSSVEERIQMVIKALKKFL
ncbi:MAG: M20 family metallopeptidase [Cetobacterium sp.]|uniref:M20 family metallopeptidase n=1 Tax=Cetobacterium sp. TaxID=2071632 RepID=UPI002FC6B0F7